MAIKPRLAFLACLLTASFAPAQGAEVKIGFVNMDRIVREAPAAIRLGKRLQQEFDPRDQELRQLAGKIQTIKESLERDGMTLSESQRRNKERELNDLSREFERRQRQFQEDLSLRQQEESSALIEKANVAIKRVAESENLDLVLQDAVWFSEGINITGKVIRLLSGD